MKVKDIMTQDPITIKESASLIEAERLLAINKIGRLIVTDDEEEVVGIITDGDFMEKDDLEESIAELVSRDLIYVNEEASVQEVAQIISEHQIGGVPVFDEQDNLTGIITAEDIVDGYVRKDRKDYRRNDIELDSENITPESAAIYLSMTRSREYEEYWLDKIEGYGYKGAITQTGASAEKLPIKLRESTTVAAIARGVIEENSREKMAISNAVKDAYSQLALINPGLGGGFKIAVVRGEKNISVSIFGKFGHALVDGPEQLTIGTSVI
ncbi:HutP family protein [Halarsenatibacter silvermanii]|nr:HutP family protein [Halarsenatibacter silvermanii]